MDWQPPVHPAQQNGQAWRQISSPEGGQSRYYPRSQEGTTDRPSVGTTDNPLVGNTDTPPVGTTDTPSRVLPTTPQGVLPKLPSRSGNCPRHSVFPVPPPIYNRRWKYGNGISTISTEGRGRMEIPQTVRFKRKNDVFPRISARGYFHGAWKNHFHAKVEEPPPSRA